MSRNASQYALDEPLTFDEFLRLSHSPKSAPHLSSFSVAIAPYLFVVAFIAILAATVWGLRVVGGA
jgi:hypothetical protein